MTNLIDIELLIEKVRSPQGKSYIREAVDCYKAGAYRSCVVATWVALLHDFVDKFRELAVAGDPSAKALVADFDATQKARDTTKALNFERDVLNIARDDYELISAQEQTDLRRIYEDRNRFAHPNLNQDSEILRATAELARLHLRSAVEHVMMRPPVQGKVALNEIREAVDSQYFPKSIDDAVTALAGTPLLRAKKSVIKEFYLGCLTSLLSENLSADPFDRRYSAAMACQRLHPAAVDELIDDRVPAVFEKTPDGGLPYLIVLLSRAPSLRSKVSASLTLRVQAFVESGPDQFISVLNHASDIDFLRSQVGARLIKLSSAQLSSLVRGAARQPSDLVIERCIECYEQSSNFEAANSVGAAIAERMTSKLSERQAERLVRAGTNAEVKYSFNYPTLIRRLHENSLIHRDRLQELVAELDLDTLRSLAFEEASGEDFPTDPAE